MYHLHTEYFKVNNTIVMTSLLSFSKRLLAALTSIGNSSFSFVDVNFLPVLDLKVLNTLLHLEDDGSGTDSGTLSGSSTVSSSSSSDSSQISIKKLSELRY